MTDTTRAFARQVAIAQLARHGAVRSSCPTTTQGLPCRHEAGHSGAHSIRLQAGQSIVLRAV